MAIFPKISLALTLLLGSAWAVWAQNYVSQMMPRTRLMATRGGAAFRHSFDGFCFRAPRATGSLGPYPTGFARDYAYPGYAYPYAYGAQIYTITLRIWAMPAP